MLSNADTIQDVHIVYAAYNGVPIAYKEWDEDLASLTKLELVPKWHTKLDATVLGALAVVRLRPDDYVMQGAWNALLEKELAKQVNPKPTHYALKSVLTLDNDQASRPQTLWYGFLLVTMVLDALRRIDGNAVRAQLVATEYPGVTRLPPPDDTNSAALRDNDGCYRIPDDVGLGMVLRVIRTHPHMGWGARWIAVFAIYYGLFVWAATNVIFWDNRSIYWVAAHALHAVFVAYSTHHRIIIPHGMYGIEALLLYPLYLAASPVVFLYARLYGVRTKLHVRGGVK